MKKLLLLFISFFTLISVYGQNPYLIEDIRPGSFPSSISGLTNINNTLFFTGNNGVDIPFFKIEPDIENVQIITTEVVVSPNGTGSTDSYFTDINGTLFFTAETNSSGRELWKSDGTGEGTILVKDIRSGIIGSNPQQFININNNLYFTASDGIHSVELWKSDGTEEGTILVKDIRDGGSSFPRDFVSLNEILYFSADNGINGRELWRSDGTESGTFIVKDLINGSSSTSDLTVSNNLIFFTATNQTSGIELFKSDGTESGTLLVKDLNPGGGSSIPTGLTDVDGTLFFTLAGTNTVGLYKSDGTANGTVLVKDFTNINGSFLYEIYNFNGTAFFGADGLSKGLELWKSDGTDAGTVLVKDINIDEGSSNPGGYGIFNNELYFYADNGVIGTELWKTDGTESGTALIKDINIGSESGIPRPFIEANGILYFTAKPKSSLGIDYGEELMAIGNCTPANNPYDSSASLENVIYNTEVQTNPSTQTCYCNLFNELLSVVDRVGSNPVSNITINKVYVDDVSNELFVKRHYELVPDTNIALATGKITLYFTQEDFDSFNTEQTQSLPTNASDDSNKQNIRIELKTGESSDGSGDRDSYTGEIQVINPLESDIIWNSITNNWEVSFNTNGFGGFWLTNEQRALSITNETLGNFKLYPNPAKNEFTIQLSNLSELQNVNIYNNLGQLVLSSKETTVNTTDLSNGLYVVEIETNKAIASRKLLIE